MHKSRAAGCIDWGEGVPVRSGWGATIFVVILVTVGIISNDGLSAPSRLWEYVLFYLTEAR